MIVGWVTVALAFVGAIYSVLCAFALGRLLQSTSTSSSPVPPVTLLKPLCGAEGELLANLESFFVQDYPTATQILFGVHDADDPAVEVVNELRKKYPDADIALVISPLLDDCNPKIANLIGMLPSAKYDVLVLSDSDIKVPANYLRKVISALDTPDVGAVTCLYSGRAVGNLWSSLSAMGINYQFLPGAAFTIATGLLAPCFGSTIALKKSVLQEIGGFEPLRKHLADDYEIGRAICALGYRLAYPPIVLTHACTERSAAELFRHELRWARTIRSINWAGYVGTITTHIILLGLIGVWLLAFSIYALAMFSLIVAARTFLKFWIDRTLKQKGPTFALLLRRDFISFAVFLCSFFVARVSWRGSHYRLGAEGSMKRV